MTQEHTENADGSYTINGLQVSEESYNWHPEQVKKISDKVRAFFVASGFEVKKMYQLANMYAGGAITIRNFYYVAKNPWWLVQTDRGDIVLGPRKRVYHIDWEATDFRGIITEDDVTKGEDFVHAYGTDKIVEHLIALRKAMDAAGTDVENHIHLDLTNALGADIAGAQMTGMHLNIIKGNDRRKVVIESLKNVARQIGANLDHNPEIKITMPCGEVVIYENFMHIPLVDVACPCGEPNHALIKWGAA